MSRGYEASAPAFDRHLTIQRQIYGKQVIINLLGLKEGEHKLGQAFQSHLKASHHCNDVPYIAFDYHSECRGGNTKNLAKLRDVIKKYYEDFGYFHCRGDDVSK